MAKRDRQDGDPLPKRGGFFPVKRRDGDPDGWSDKKREDHTPTSTDHVPKHGRDGYPLGNRNP